MFSFYKYPLLPQSEAGYWARWPMGLTPRGTSYALISLFKGAEDLGYGLSSPGRRNVEAIKCGDGSSTGEMGLVLILVLLL